MTHFDGDPMKTPDPFSFTCHVSDDIRIVGQIFPTSNPAGTVLIAHGLPSGRPRSDANDPGYPGLARELAALGAHVIIFNFRGTGSSGGHLEVDRWPDDLGAVIDWWERPSWKTSRLIGVGSSTGGSAIIVQSARDDRLEHVITFAAPADFSFLDAAKSPEEWFALYRQMGMIRDGYDKTPTEWALTFSRLNAVDVVGQSRAKTMTILHGSDDEVVPVEHARTLATRSGRATIEILPNVTHQMRRDPRAVEALKRHIQTIIRK